jgi:hypothetical protein
MSRWSTANRLGNELFTVAAVMMMIYAMLTGPLATADCLSRERREGTLGLLFLTPLRGVDVVLGKISAASLDHLLGLFAMLPLLAIPFMLGGVSPAQVGFAAVGIFCLLVFSLSVGACASSLCTDSRAALGLTLSVLLALTFGPPVFMELANASRWFPGGDDLLGMPCPLYTMACCLEVSSRGAAWKLWGNLATLAAMTSFCLFVAVTRTSRAWRETEPSAFLRRWLNWARLLNKPSLRSLPARRLLLDFNPLAWLETRDRLQDRILSVLLLLNAGFWILLAGKTQSVNTSLDLMVVWSMTTQYLLCLWIAVQAPRRLIDDRLSGALELLLCTDHSPRDYVRGAMHAWGLRFGRAVIYLLAFEALLIAVHCVTRGDFGSFLRNDLAQLWLLSMLVFPFQAYAIGKVGLYEAMVRRNSIWASAHLVLKIVIFPWVLFFGCMVLMETVLRNAGMMGGLNDTIAMTTWTITQLAPVLFLLPRANAKLQWRFRELASEPRVPWWKRLLQRRWGLIPAGNAVSLGKD